MEATIIGFDIKEFSSSKDSKMMSEKRNTLRDLIQQSSKNLTDIQNSFNDQATPDTGDGCYMIIDSGDFLSVINFFYNLKDLIENQSLVSVRAVIHRGEVEKTNNLNNTGITWIGNGINDAARYLEAEPLKTLVSLNSSKKFMFGISPIFYDKICSLPEFKKTDYDEYSFKVKEFCNKIYLNIVGMKLPEKKDFLELKSFKLQLTFKNELYKIDFIYPDKTKPTNLNTFFVYPDLLSKDTSKKTEKKIDSKKLSEQYLSRADKILIAGGEMTGKTSLAKKYFEDIYSSKHYLPLFIACRKDNKKLLKNLISKLFNSQYEQKYSKELNNKIVLIFDNFHNWEFEYQSKIIHDLDSEGFSKVILFTDLFFIEQLKNLNMINHYQIYQIKNFGHVKRLELINKWISFLELPNTNFEAIDELNQYINKTLINGLLPCTPFFILTILLAKKDYLNNPNDEITSKAHCYQALVYIQLKYMGINDNQVNAYLNIFGYIAFFLYSNNREFLSESEFKNLIEKYKEEFLLDGEIEDIIKTFKKSSIFTNNNGFNQYGFTSEYVYFYFLGKYLAEHYNCDTIKDKINTLFQDLSDNTNYYVAIFVVHHLKNEPFFDTIAEMTKELYKDYPEAKLTKEELKHIDNIYKETEKIFIEKLDRSDSNRIKAAEINDVLEEDDDSAISIQESIVVIQHTIRLVELIGQIVKNHGEIKKIKLKKYYLLGMSTYKRICMYFISNFKNYEKEFIKYIEESLLFEKNYSTEEVKKEAYKLFAGLHFLSITATVFRTTDALGAKHLIADIIKPILDDDITPINYCIYLHSLMWYKKEIPIDELKVYIKQFPDTIIFLIKLLLKDYTDKHHIDIKKKQRLASALNMEIKDLEYDVMK